MDPIQMLTGEHNRVKVLLEVLEAMCGRLESKQKVTPEHIQGVMYVIKNFADKAHHLKEEILFFPALEKAGVSREEMLVDSLTTEHDLGRGYVRGISDALLPYSMGDDRTGQIICQNVRKYVKLMKTHMEREEGIVFPLAESKLSDDAKREMAEEFERIDREVIGEEKREKFESILSTLRGTYLTGER